MPRKKSYLTVTDQFCGAGGSSQGVRRLAQRSGGGLEVRLALNHWKLAIETHNTNFPDTMHDCTDISAADPRRYPSTDILITSPECTTHSPAGGNNHKTLRKQMDMFDSGAIDPATERSRATMWDVCRFAEYHKYRCIIVENVVEAKTRWALFDVWLTAMNTLGYNHRLVFHNSMHHHPTPQSRDRMYIVFWQKGQRAPMLDHTPAANCPKCAKDVKSVQTWKDKRKNWGKYRTQYVYCCPKCSTIVEPYYYASFNCIDWSDIGIRIGDRKKMLVKNTLDRIKYGLDKYGKQPLIVTQKYASEGPQQSIKHIGEALRCQPTQAAHGICTPFLIDDKQSTGVGFRAKAISDTTCTIHTDPRVKLVMPFLIDSAYGGSAKSLPPTKATQTTQHTEGLVSPPFIVENKTTPTVRSCTTSLSTQTTSEFQSLVTPPFIPIARGKSKTSSSLDALGTQSQMINHGVVTTEAWNSFLSYYYGTHNTSGINEAVNTVSCNDRAAVISYQAPAVEDCYYRMLKPNEIQLAMAFGADYTVLGSSKDKVKQLGNAVTPPAMEWLVEQCVASLQ